MLLINVDKKRKLLGRWEENAYVCRMMKVAEHDNIELMELDGYGHNNMVYPTIPLLLKFIKQNTSTEANTPKD